MKNFFRILFFITAFYRISFSQIVTTTPTYPTQNDSIVVYFDATQIGASELLNYTGTVYAHTGVTVDSAGVKTKNWQYVIGTWGQTNQPSLTRLGPNLYRLTIGKPRAFYKVTNPLEKIIQFDLVFRSSDATKQTRPDIFYNLYESGLTLVVNNPQVSVKYGDPQRSPFFVTHGDTIPINISAATLGTEVSSLNLYVDGNQVAQSDSAQVSYNFAYTNFSTGAHNIKVVGVDTLGIKDSTTFMLFCNPPINYSPLPVGLRPGINYTGPTTATLALFAPHKSFIYALGDFNDWKVQTNYFMNCDSVNSDSVIWWVNLTSLSPGTEYAFQYLVDGNLRIADPFTHKILDPWNDKYIPSTVYPNLKPYPDGKTAEIVSVLQTAQQPYSWNITNFKKPGKSKLVVYELLVRDFVSTHWFKTIMDTLDYLKDLGINAIELMPVMEFEGNESWGYNSSFHLALDKYYGTPNVFKALIDSAHSKGIAVILDIVLNHAFGQNPLVRMYFDGYYTIGSNSGIKTTPNNPYFNVTSPNTSYFWGADFNHAKPATQYYVDRITKYWIEEFRIDGYRFDFAKGFTNTFGDGSAYDASRITIMQRIANKIWTVDSTSILILENFVDNTEEQVESNFGFLTWGNMNYNYNEATMGYNASGNSDLRAAYYGYRGFPKPTLVTYMESHDEERLMYKNLRFGNSYGTYNIQSLSEALNRMKLAAAFFIPFPGPKMIWQFGELGYDYSIFYDPGINAVPEPYGSVGKDYARTYPKPIKWDYLSDARRMKLYKVFKSLIDLKINYDAFSSNVFIMSVTDTVKKINLYHSSMDIFIIGNFGVKQTTANQSFSKSGWWYDYFSGDSTNVKNLTAPITLQPGEFKLYTTTRLPKPEADLLTEVETDQPVVVVSEYKLDQNYPNPFNPETQIRYSVKETQLVQLKVFDILGKEVVTLVNEVKTAGAYDITWNASSFPSGVYFYRIQAGSFVSTKKMILLK